VPALRKSAQTHSKDLYGYRSIKLPPPEEEYFFIALISYVLETTGQVSEIAKLTPVQGSHATS